MPARLISMIRTRVTGGESVNDLKQPRQKVVCRERPPQVIVSMKFRLAVYFSSNLLIQFYLNSFS